MSSFKRLFLLFSFALSAAAVVTPHVARSPHDHHALAARMAAPAVGPYGNDIKVVKPKKMRKRQDIGRCKAKSSSSSETPSSTPESTPDAGTPVVNVAPSPSDAPTDTPTPTPTPSPSPTPPEPEPTTSDSPAPAPAPAPTTTSDSGNSGNSDSSSPSFMQGTQTGEATFYAIGLGACGKTNGGNDRIAAVSKLLFDAFPGYDGTNSNNNPVCGMSVTANYNGKSTTVTIEDRCEACALTDLDLSPAAFQDLADESVGRLSGMTWTWNN